MQLVIALGVVIVAILVCAWLARRFLRFTPGAAGPLRVVAGASLGAREKVMLVQAGETQILLGVSPGRVQALHVLEHPVDPAASAAASTGPSFAEQLRRLRSTDPQSPAAPQSSEGDR